MLLVYTSPHPPYFYGGFLAHRHEPPSSIDNYEYNSYLNSTSLHQKFFTKISQRHHSSKVVTATNLIFYTLFSFAYIYLLETDSNCRHSTWGCCIYFGPILVMWWSKMQTLGACLSTGGILQFGQYCYWTLRDSNSTSRAQHSSCNLSYT